MRATDHLTPDMVRDHCQLSPITRDELGKPRTSISAELKNAETIYANHEAEAWAALINPNAEYPEADYDTVYPELMAYIAELRRAN